MKKIVLILCTLMMVFGFTLTSYASEVPTGYYSYNNVVLPYLPSDLPYQNTFVMRGDSGYYFYNTSAEFTYRPGGFFTVTEKPFKAYTATVDDVTWTFAFEGTFGVGYDPVVFPSSEILWSSVTVRDDNGYIWMDGDDFFLTMAQKVLALAGGTLTEKTVPQTMETMALLMACGVGLMALLMALPLLKNKFSHFLP